MGRYPWTEVLLFEGLHIAVLYPTPHHAYRVAVLATMIYLSSKIYSTPEVTDPLTVTYTVGFMVGFQFIFIAYLLSAEGAFPDNWRRVRDEAHAKAVGDGSNSRPSGFSLTKKLWWMVDIAYSVRMVGWIQEPQNGIPPHPPPSRRTFLWKTFLKLIINNIIADFSTSALALSPAFDRRVHDPSDGPETYLSAVPLLHRAPYILSYGIMMGTGTGVVHNIMALVCVGIFRSSPTLWPDIWGRWGDAYTLRKLWGQTWHQRMRPMFGGLGKLVANKLKLPRGSNRSSYTQLYVAFFLSGILHFSGDFMLERRMVSRSFKFFLLQAVAITFEDLVIHIAKRLLRRGGVELKPGGVDESWADTAVRVVGYCWVTLWFCLTLPVWVDELNSIGVGSFDRGVITQFLLDVWKRQVKL